MNRVIKETVISETAPLLVNAFWLKPVENGFNLFAYNNGSWNPVLPFVVEEPKQVEPKQEEAKSYPVEEVNTPVEEEVIEKKTKKTETKKPKTSKKK